MTSKNVIQVSVPTPTDLTARRTHESGRIYPEPHELMGMVEDGVRVRLAEGTPFSAWDVRKAMRSLYPAFEIEDAMVNSHREFTVEVENAAGEMEEKTIELSLIHATMWKPVQKNEWELTWKDGANGSYRMYSPVKALPAPQVVVTVAEVPTPALPSGILSVTTFEIVEAVVEEVVEQPNRLPTEGPVIPVGTWDE